MPATVLSDDGREVRETPYYRFPLPPRIPGRWEPVFNGNGQYVLPDPVTGKPTSYTRASTVAKTLEDTYMLHQWELRQALIGLHRTPHLVAELDRTVVDHTGVSGDLAAELRAPLNILARRAQYAAGSGRAAEFGTAVHAWCEAVDIGLIHLSQVPELYRPWVEGHRRALAAAGLTVVPDWTERVVLNTTYGIAGTLDRVFLRQIANDAYPVLGDIKTSRTMEYSWLYFAIQLAIYATADYVLAVDGSQWYPMPSLEPGVALVSHLPREDPEKAAIVPVNTCYGEEALEAAMHVRSLRRESTTRGQDTHYVLGCDDPRETRIREARFLVEMASTQHELQCLWEEYQDIWTDALTELGWKSLQSANANAHA